MKKEEEIAQWVIDNRYPKSENQKISDFEMFNYIVEKIQQLKNQPSEQISVERLVSGQLLQTLVDKMKELEIIYSGIKKIENGIGDDWYYSGKLSQIREDIAMVKSLSR